MRKRVFGHMRTAKAQISLSSAQSDHGLRCLLTELLNTTECINGEQMPGLDFVHARDESESVHLEHARRHLWLNGAYIFDSRYLEFQGTH